MTKEAINKIKQERERLSRQLETDQQYLAGILAEAGRMAAEGLSINYDARYRAITMEANTRGQLEGLSRALMLAE